MPHRLPALRLLGAAGTAELASPAAAHLRQNSVSALDSAYILNSDLPCGLVTVTANDTSDHANVRRAVPRSLAFGGNVGAGVAIGVSLATTRFNDGITAGRRNHGLHIRTAVSSTGTIDVEAHAHETIGRPPWRRRSPLAAGGSAASDFPAPRRLSSNDSRRRHRRLLSTAPVTLGGTPPTRQLHRAAFTIAATEYLDDQRHGPARRRVSGAFGRQCGVAAAIGGFDRLEHDDDSVAAYITGVGTLSAARCDPWSWRTEGASITRRHRNGWSLLTARGAGASGVSGRGATTPPTMAGQHAVDIFSFDDQPRLGPSVQAAASAVIEAHVVRVAAAWRAAVRRYRRRDGASVANNNTPGDRQRRRRVYAYILDSNITRAGVITVAATSSEKISAMVDAGPRR